MSLSGVSLPEKHLVGLGLWRDRDATLRERASHLQTYLNTVLRSGSKEVAVLLADFACVDVITFSANFLLQEESSAAAAEPLPAPPQPPLGLRGALSCVVTLLVGAAWIALLAAWVLFSDMVALVVRRAHALRASLGDRAAAAKSSFSTAIIVRVERRPRLSSMPKPVPQLAELLNACFLERKISFSAMLTGVASTVFLHPPVVALVKRLPEEPRLRCARALQACLEGDRRVG